MKKYLSMFLVFAMICTMLLSGCGSAPAAETASSAETGSAAESAPATEPEQAGEPSQAPAETEEPGSAAETAQEAAPEKVTVEYPLSEEPITLTAYWSFSSFLGMFGVTAGNASEMSMFRAAEEATNVHLDITFVAEESYSTTLPLLWASGDYMDLLSAAEGNYAGGADAAVADEILLDIVPYLETYAPDYLEVLNSDDSFRAELTSDGGRIVTVATYQEYPDGGNVIRKDWLDGVGLDIPETMDDVLEVLRAFQTEYQVKSPLLCNSDMDYLGAWSAFGVPAPAKGADLTWFVKDGQVQCAQTAEEFYNALVWINQCYEEKLLTDDFLSISELDQNLIAGDTGYCWATSVVLSDSEKEQSGDPDYLVVAIPDPTLEPGGTTDVGNVSGGQGGSSMCISGQTEYPEICVAYLNYYFTDEGKVLTGFGIEGEAFEYDENGEKHYTDLILNNPDGYPSFIAQALYTGFVGMPMVITTESRLALFTNDQEREALSIWPSNRTDALVYHGKLTIDENEEYSRLIGDLSTYAKSEMLKFATGARSLDEFDDYVADLEAMGLSDAQALKQQAYDRYAAALADNG